jgi:hypothetical protein
VHFTKVSQWVTCDLPEVPNCRIDGRRRQSYFTLNLPKVRVGSGAYLAVPVAKQQVTFPVPGHCTIFDGRWMLTDRDRTSDPAVVRLKERLDPSRQGGFQRKTGCRADHHGIIHIIYFDNCC